MHTQFSDYSATGVGSVKVYKLGETDATATVYAGAMGKNVQTIYIPVEDLADDNGIVQGVQIVKSLAYGICQYQIISWVADKPA